MKDSGGEVLDYIPGGVIEWLDDNEQPSLAEELRARPGRWAVIGRSVTQHRLVSAQAPWAALESDPAFEVHFRDVDDGEYGVLRDVHARFVEAAEVASNEL